MSVFERDRGGIEPYVKEMGDKMNYSVALDDVPADRGGHDGKMAVAWMAAAGEQGIPTAFIIANGKIAWIGPAMALEEPLEKVISGKWDLEAAARDRRKQRDHESKLVALYSKIGQAMRTGETKGTIDAIDAVIAGDATAEEALARRNSCSCARANIMTRRTATDIG